MPHLQGLFNNPYPDPNQPNSSYWGGISLRSIVILSCHYAKATQWKHVPEFKSLIEEGMNLDERQYSCAGSSIKQRSESGTAISTLFNLPAGRHMLPPPMFLTRRTLLFTRTNASVQRHGGWQMSRCQSTLNSRHYGFIMSNLTILSALNHSMT